MRKSLVHISIGRLAADHEVHGCEQLLLATSNKAVGGESQAVGCLLSALGCQTDGLEAADELVNDATANLGHAKDGGDIANGGDVLQLARQRPVPGVGVVTVREILVVLQDETGSLHGGKSDLDLLHVGDTVTDLDAETDLTVVGVVVIVRISHEPLVDTEDTAGLEHTEDLAVDALEGGGVDSSLNGVNSIEGVVRERHLL